MNNVKELRPNNQFKLNDQVCIGTGSESYEIVGFGCCHETAPGGGILQNGHEFIRLKVPGTTEGRLFEIHCSFVRLARG